MGCPAHLGHAAHHDVSGHDAHHGRDAMGAMGAMGHGARGAMDDVKEAARVKQHEEQDRFARHSPGPARRRACCTARMYETECTVRQTPTLWVACLSNKSWALTCILL